MEVSVAIAAGESEVKMQPGGYMQRHVSELDNLVVEYPILWPLCLAFNKQRHADLNKV